MAKRKNNVVKKISAPRFSSSLSVIITSFFLCYAYILEYA